MIDTSTLSGYLLDYYAALAENKSSPRLAKHPRSDEYICIINGLESGGFSFPLAYSPTTNPALALPIIDKLMMEGAMFIRNSSCIVACMSKPSYGNNITEAALRALVAWKFPDGLPEPIYESEK